MMKNLSVFFGILLLFSLSVAFCSAQEQPATQPAGQAQTDAALLAEIERYGAAHQYSSALNKVREYLQRGPQDISGLAGVLGDLAGAANDMTVPELLELADLFRQLRQYAHAIGLLTDVLQRDKNNIDALRLAGDVAWDMQKAEEAAKYWNLVKRIQSNDFAANWGLGRLWLRSGQPRQAMGYLETAITVIPPDRPELGAEVLIALAQAYGGAGDHSRAIDTINKALEIDRQNLNAWYVLATLRSNAAVTLDDFNDALGDTSQLIVLTDADIKTNGMTPARLQRISEAYDLRLSVLWAHRGLFFERNPDGNPSDRLLPGMAQTAARNNTAVIDTWMKRTDLQRTSQHFRILEFAQIAATYESGDQPELLFRLGSLQVATGQFDDAAETFQRVLALDPTNELARQQLDALQAYQPASAPAAIP